ncbi:NAD(P)-binding protein [Starkeya sp. ORNL1]|uniref:FAD-dependent oxidoreductase n=1 Tax=Starkeya sp. ORNL1 TaxID=2709380 RepID=UPI001463F21F|nr:FAD-dependent oxidoreductase [Starkeya sp. ORNL1]QJP12775.1 NAD(P)-binding protein [Starkeya sp. ORNL1]
MKDIPVASDFSSVDSSFPKYRVAIIGGGPGGLFTARHLAAKAGNACSITIYEASERLGGKIVTKELAGVGIYEAGVAEIYDYSALGPDPLRDLIQNELGLEIKHISGGACILDSKIIVDSDHLGAEFGDVTQEQVSAFRQKRTEMLRPQDYYSSARNVDNRHPWARISGEDVIAAEMSDEMARRYVRVMAHSDVAAPPHLTNGLTFLKNALMDSEGYIDVFSVIGGNEQIVDRLVEQIDADVRFNASLNSVRPLFDGTYQLGMCINGTCEAIVADYVVLCLPLTALSIIDWRSPHLQQAMARHINYFDRPGHYLRATLVFQRPFWRELLPGAWWMLDAFDGCCVYDEGARNAIGSWGVLGFLIAGNAALGLANLSDSEIEKLCLDALPPELAIGKRLIVDSRVHRWMASVNAIPGGYPVRSPYQNHRPTAEQLPGLITVGDYLFDATLNGVLDSADAATDILVAEILGKRQAYRKERIGGTTISHWFIGDDEEQGAIFNASYLAELLELVWGVRPGARILNIGSGRGRLVAGLRALGFDAIGIEPSRSVWAKTPRELREVNLCCALADMKLAAGYFDVVLDTGLCRFERAQLSDLLKEVRRVTRYGLVLGSATVDLPIEFVERKELLSGIGTFTSRWDWADQLIAVGFGFALADPRRLDVVWKKTVAAGLASGVWYEDPESVLYCFYGTEASAAQDLDAIEAAERIIRDHLYEDERIPAALITAPNP